MKYHTPLITAALLVSLFSMVLGLVIVPSHAANVADEDLTKQLAAVQPDFYKIKPGMTRAELEKVFSKQIGGSTNPHYFRQHETFDYRRSVLLHVDIDFRASDSKEDRPTDIIDKISKPYLAPVFVF